MLTSVERLRVLSHLFTRPTVAALSRTGDWGVACSFLHKHHLITPGDSQPLSNLFEAAWELLKREYRNEYIYKNEIANRIVFGLHSPRTAALHLELPVGRSIVDAGVFNGNSTAYEIKTEFDTARRLSSQTLDYLRAFERVFVVTHPEFAETYAKLLPHTIGVLSLSKRGSLSEVKGAVCDRSRLDATVMFRCLRRKEFLAALSPIEPKLRLLPNGKVSEEGLAIFKSLDLDTAHALYLHALRDRSTSGGLPEFLRHLPRCLRALGCGTPLSSKQRQVLVATLNRPVEFRLA